MKKRKTTLAVALVLVALVAIGGTIAWLMDSTQTVTNTFTAGDVDITLQETGTTPVEGGEDESKTYTMVPGAELAKDPSVTVLADSEACWVFVEVKGENNATVSGGTFLTYAVESGWTQGTGTIPENVWWRAVDNTDADQKFAVLADNKVTVNTTVTKTDLDSLTAETYPTLSFKAYAIQKDDNVASAQDAWAKLHE